MKHKLFSAALAGAAASIAFVLALSATESALTLIAVVVLAAIALLIS